MTDLGDRLRQLRAPLTQEQLGAVLNVSAALISSWESGRAVPPQARLQQYAEHLDPGNGLLDELTLLSATTRGVPPPEPTVLEVLKDIRWLLQQIRDRLPPLNQ